MRRRSRELSLMSLAAIGLILLLVGCGADDTASDRNTDDRDRPARDADSGEEDLDLEDSFTIEELVDLTMDVDEFCEGYRNLPDDPEAEELAFEAFQGGIGESPEEFGFSAREVFDEAVSRC